jgi:hypothetical protein
MWSVLCPRVIILPCILVTRQQHVVNECMKKDIEIYVNTFVLAAVTMWSPCFCLLKLSSRTDLVSVHIQPTVQCVEWLLRFARNYMKLACIEGRVRRLCIQIFHFLNYRTDLDEILYWSLHQKLVLKSDFKINGRQGYDNLPFTG